MTRERGRAATCAHILCFPSTNLSLCPGTRRFNRITYNLVIYFPNDTHKYTAIITQREYIIFFHQNPVKNFSRPLKYITRATLND